MTTLAPISWPLRLVLALMLAEQLVVCLPPDAGLNQAQPSEPLGIINWSTFTKVFKRDYSSLAQQLVRHKLFIAKQLQVFITAGKWYLGLSPNYLVINKFSDLTPNEELRLLSGNQDETVDGRAKVMDDERVGRLLEEELEFLSREPAAPTKASATIRQKRDLSPTKHRTASSHIKPSMGLLDLENLSQKAKIRPPQGLLDVKDLVRLPNNEHLLVRAKHPNLKWWVPTENPFYEPLDLFSRGSSPNKVETIADIPEDQLAKVDEVATGWLTNSASDSSGLADLVGSGLSWVPQELKLDSLAGAEPNRPSRRSQPAVEVAQTDNQTNNLTVVHKDWRETGCVAPPYSQGDCFSCYAISSMAFIEWAYCMNRNRVLTPLSAQYLISCGPQFKRESAPRLQVEFNGCSMGRSRHALLFVQEYGAELEMHMPYVAEDTRCPVEPNTPAKYKGYLRPNVKSTIRMASKTQQLDKALSVGPVIAVFRAPVDFLAYGGGMIQNCYPDASHAMLVVGHGVENNIPYLLIKNSFGTDWGEGGYFKFDRRFTLECVKEFFLPRVRFPSQKSQMRRIKAHGVYSSGASNQGVEPGNFETHFDKLDNVQTH